MRRNPSPEALGAELAQLRPRMTSLALRFANASAAEDIVQNAYEKAVRNLCQFRGGARFSTWLHRIVVNESLMWLRSERRRGRRFVAFEADAHDRAWVEPAPGADERLAAHERDSRVRVGLDALPAPEREVLLHCALGEVSYDDFCARTGIRPAAAKSRAFRARQRLRGLLEGAREREL